MTGLASAGAVGDLTYRPVRTEELEACAEIWRVAINDYIRHLGQPDIMTETGPLVRLYRHLSTTDPERFVVAVRAGGAPDEDEVVAFVASVVRERLWFLSMLFVSPEIQAAGIGRPIGHPERGPYLAWLAYYAGVIEPVVSIEFAGLAENALLQRTFRDGDSMRRRLLTALESGPYLLGESFSAADILVVSMGQFVREMLPPGKVVDDYLARCSARPALARAWAKDGG